MAHPTGVFPYIHFRKMNSGLLPHRGLECEFDILSWSEFSRESIYECLILVGSLARKASQFKSLISSFVAPFMSLISSLIVPSVDSDLWEVSILENEHLLSAVLTAQCISWVGLFTGSEAMTETLPNKGLFWQNVRRPPGHASETENSKFTRGVPSFSHQQVIDNVSSGWTCS